MSPIQRYAITRIVPAIVFAGIIIHAAGFTIYLLYGFLPALLALLISYVAGWVIGVGMSYEQTARGPAQKCSRLVAGLLP